MWRSRVADGLVGEEWMGNCASSVFEAEDGRVCLLQAHKACLDQ